MDLPCNFRMLSWACSLQTWSKTDAEFMAGKWLGRTSIRASSQTQKVTQQLTLWSLKDKNKSEWCLGLNGTLLIREINHVIECTQRPKSVKFNSPIPFFEVSEVIYFTFYFLHKLPYSNMNIQLFYAIITYPLKDWREFSLSISCPSHQLALYPWLGAL